MEGPTTTRDFREKRKRGGVYSSGGPPPENVCIFELPRLDFLQFQHDSRSFLDKKGLLPGGKNPLVGGEGRGGGGDGTTQGLGLWPFQYIC